VIIPSIDLMDGKAVQLQQGRDKMLEREDPVALAREFGKFGQIAVIDLDAAMGKGGNQDVIRKICAAADCRVGGGIRSVEDGAKTVSGGAVKIIVGTKAFENDTINHAFLDELSAAVGRERIMVAIDARGGEIVTKAWKHRTGLPVLDTAARLEKYVSNFLFTCVEKEGMLQGTDMETIGKLKQAVQARLTVAGGISTMGEIEALARLGVDAQLGMALYTGKIKLDEGFIRSLSWKTNLLPTITCDTSGQVLMLAYSSRESLQKAFDTGVMWYFSRSRGKLWMKGETSGNTQQLVSMRADCDSDALLATVRQTGPACHEGSYSCFGDRKFSLQELYDVIRGRFENPVEGSYTATLTPEKVREKMLEEAREVVEAEGKDEIIWEAADVLYFLTALLARSGVTLDEALGELKRRRRK